MVEFLIWSILIQLLAEQISVIVPYLSGRKEAGTGVSGRDE
jgi:hypothetical protein